MIVLKAGKMAENAFLRCIDAQCMFTVAKDISGAYGTLY